MKTVQKYLSIVFNIYDKEENLRLNRIPIAVSLGLALLMPMYADEETESLLFVPALVYEFNSYTNQYYHNPGIGFGIYQGDQSPIVLDKGNSLKIELKERMYLLDQPLYDYPNIYHYIDITADKKINRHLILGVFVSKSSAPVYGGLHTFQTGIGYGYEIVNTDYISFTLGGGLGVSDFGIRSPDGAIWPVIPLPIVRFNLETQWFNMGFEFITNPSIKFAIFQKERIHFTGSLSISEFNSIQDLYFDCSLWYRLFKKDFVLGDFAGIGIGVRNSGVGFTTEDRDKTYKLNGYSVFGTLDLSLLQIIGGYNITGRERYGSDNTRNLDSGYFITIQGSYSF